MKWTLVAAITLASAFTVNAQESAASFFANDPAAPAVSAAPQVVAAVGSRTRRVAASSAAEQGHSSTPGSVMALVDSAARRHGVPVNIARATVMHESRGRCNARGRAGELGPLQIKPATARGLGFSGSASALQTCGAGLEWGMKHLALAFRKCGHVGPHQAGLGASCARTAYVRKVMGNA